MKGLSDRLNFGFLNSGDKAAFSVSFTHFSNALLDFHKVLPHNFIVTYFFGPVLPRML